jgi:AsmA protein
MPSTPKQPSKAPRSGKPAAAVKTAKPGRKPLKIVGISVAVIIGLLIITAIVLPFVINPNDFKPRITKLVQDKTGRSLDIQGNIKLSIFPWLGVQIGPMQLSNASGFGNMPFASINEADIHVRFLPLLRGQVEIGNIKLEGASIDLERDAAGRTNWQDMLDHFGKASAAPTTKTTTANNSVLEKLRIAGLQLSDTRLRWNDAQNHQQYTVSDLDLDMGAFAPAQAVRLTLGFDFAGTNPRLNGHANFKGTLIVDPLHKIYTADDAKLEATANGDAVPGGQVNATLIWKHIVANLQADTVAINHLDASAYGATMHLDMQGKNITRHPVMTGKLTLDRFSPRQVLTALGHGALVETRDPGALSSASAGFDFVAATDSVTLQNLQLKLDDTTLSGQAAVKDFKSRALSFNLNVDKLDADRYLPPQKAGTPEKPREPFDINKVSIPVRTLRSLNLDGQLNIGQFILMGATIGNLDLGLSAHQGLVKLDPLSAALYGGTLDGNVQVDVRGDAPSVSEDLSLKGVQAGGLIKDLFKVDRLSGGVELQSVLQARGATVGELRHTMDGHLKFAFSNGAYQGVNLWDSIERAYAKLKHLPAPPAAPQRTEFADVHGSATVRRGVLDNRDFIAALPYLKVTGAGKIDLAENTLDYAVKAHITGTPKVGAEHDLGKLTDTVIPLRITGTFSDLSIRPDLGDVAHEKAQAAANTKKAELQKRLDAKRAAEKKKAENKLKNLLKGGGGGG